jgi:hypothetical protein
MEEYKKSRGEGGTLPVLFACYLPPRASVSKKKFSGPFGKKVLK